MDSFFPSLSSGMQSQTTASISKGRATPQDHQHHQANPTDSTPLCGPFVPFIAVHAGAGSHNLTRTAAYADLLAEVVVSTLQLLQYGQSDVDGTTTDTTIKDGTTHKAGPGTLGISCTEAVVHAIKLLETSPLTNSGIAGANMTDSGTVECDAAIMTSKTDPDANMNSTRSCITRNRTTPTDGHSATTTVSCFGGVGAVPMTHPPPDTLDVISSPIEAAACLSHGDLVGPHPTTGRVPPMMLCGHAVHDYAKMHSSRVACVSVASARNRMTHSQLARFKLHQQIVANADNRTLNPTGATMDTPASDLPTTAKVESEESEESGESEDPSELLLDTVGAIAMDTHGNISAGVSSGGISLKHMGRVGEAAIYGAGVWAQRSSISNPHGVGISVSGCGEQIMKIQLASRLAEALCGNTDTDLTLDISDTATEIQQFLHKSVMTSSRLNPVDADRHVGMLVLRTDLLPETIDSNRHHRHAYPTNNKDAKPLLKRPRSDCHLAGIDSNSTPLQPQHRMVKELWWAHTTKTMCFAHMSANDTKPTFHMSMQPRDVMDVVVGGTMVK
ncbi:hypothetical protein BASA50_008718 [Batrachochytrium salamandrivorans]|uniref:Uncharacterized protein n=1 Tax=Batrachochytrium salamandrivorans TaxID=1357716 RepID=A0ABQ8F3A2_9FUNG|nr:hypothetical protein BASA50_008718 [Batrachochytrium salamandrivorans]